MLPENRLKINVSEDGVVLFQGYASEIRLIGTSCLAVLPSAKSSDFENSFSIAVPEKSFQDNQEEVVVIRTVQFINKVYDYVNFFVRIVPEDKGAVGFVRLGENWIPKPDRLAVIDEREFIKFFVEGVEYSTNPEAERYVPDPNLVCRYLVGKEDEQAIKEAAQCQKEEVSAKAQLEALMSELKEKDEVIANQAGELHRLSREKGDLSQRLGSKEAALQDIIELRNGWSKCALIFRDAAETSCIFFIRKRRLLEFANDLCGAIDTKKAGDRFFPKEKI